MLRRAVVVALATFVAPASAVAANGKFPNGHVWGCYNVSKGMPFCDSTLPIPKRVDDLLQRLTLAEKAGLMGADTKTGVPNACLGKDAGVERLGIPGYMHLVEFNTAVAAGCYADDKCATEFPGPTGLGASFNRTLWHAKGAVLSDEFRAFNNLNWHRTINAPNSIIGLTGFGPNINIVRDPRWGRNSEVPSEDPYLAGEYASSYVRGGQVGSDPRYLKVAMGLKHYAAYSMETNRFSFLPNISKHDLWETFLPGYRAGFDPKQGNASAAMCSYAGVFGVPSCASEYLINTVRDTWGNKDAVIATDCGALENMANSNHFASSTYDAAGKTLAAGTDMELGDTMWAPTANGGQGMLERLADGNSSMAGMIDASLRRSLTMRFKLGLFDPLEDQPYTRLGAEAINTTAARKLTYEAALQSFVLLQNHASAPLPIQKGASIAVVGPHSVSQINLYSDYHGDMICPGGGYSCVETIAAAFTARHPARVRAAKGVDLDSNNTSGVPAALAAAAASDFVVLCLGIGKDQEHESIDRASVALPGLQTQFAEQIIALGKPTVIVIVNGGAVPLGPTLTANTSVIEAFYPATQGAAALYAAVVGDENRWGKMPITVMSAASTEKLELSNFDMAKPPGRTYKYFTDVPEWKFGAGLSYTEFALSACGMSSVNVANVGSRTGDEVVMVYHSVSADIRAAAQHPVPLRELVFFDRVTLEPGSTVTLLFPVTASTSSLVNAAGVSTLYPGTHYLTYSTGNHECTHQYTVASQ